MNRKSADEVEALRKVLAAEHAAVYAYGLLGARTTGALRSRVSAAFDAHRGMRDQLRSLITTRGGKPSEPEASYALPVTPGSAAEAVRLAVQIESGVTTAYLELTATPSPALRRLAALAMQESATRSYGFRPTLTAFPGMPAPASPSPSASPTSSG
ncbi:ferritin-like domain-containing protein [Nonomuraea sp. NPDC046570]|uniref:ferritin-like domain-containing protein n=1 Tax=Nonomuraea sp. NPDC046570 TaxID=3155255 RepID=UPI0033FB12BC